MNDVSCMWRGTTIGIDLGDKESHLCVLDESGDVLEESRLRTTSRHFAARFKGLERLRIVIETGTHTNWVADLLRSFGHQVVVANARKARAIFQNPRKDDRTDAQSLARIGRLDPRLLYPVAPREADCRRDLALMRTRDALVRSRTRLVNHVRGIAKSAGHRIPGCSAAAFHKQELPAELESTTSVVMSTIGGLSATIKILDDRIDALCDLEHPQTKLLRQVHGVGPLTALGFVLIVGDPSRFKSARAVGSYAGLTTRRHASGERDPQLRITKAGDEMLRTLLVQAAQHILGPFGPDSDLRRFGKRLEKRGGKYAKQRAVIATARKLAVLLAVLLRTAEVYEPLRNHPEAQTAPVA